MMIIIVILLTVMIIINYKLLRSSRLKSIIKIALCIEQ